MLGLSCVTAPLLIVVAPFISRLRRVFTPLVSGVVVLMIARPRFPPHFMGSPFRCARMRAVARPRGGGGRVAVILAAQASCRAWARIAGAACGVIAGCIVCGLLGDCTAGNKFRWLVHPGRACCRMALPSVGNFVPPFAFIYLVSLLEAMVTSPRLATIRAQHTGRAHCGVVRRRPGRCITSTVAALFGGFPSATYAQNNGVIQITGVAKPAAWAM